MLRTGVLPISVSLLRVCALTIRCFLSVLFLGYLPVPVVWYGACLTASYAGRYDEKPEIPDKNEPLLLFEAAHIQA